MKMSTVSIATVAIACQISWYVIADTNLVSYFRSL